MRKQSGIFKLQVELPKDEKTTIGRKWLKKDNHGCSALQNNWLDNYLEERVTKNLVCNSKHALAEHCTGNYKVLLPLSVCTQVFMVLLLLWSSGRRLSTERSTTSFLAEWDLYLPMLHHGQDAVWFSLQHLIRQLLLPYAKATRIDLSLASI